MFDRLDFYFRQLVTEGDLDLAFDQVQTAVEESRADDSQNISGIASGGALVPAGVPDLTVTVVGPGIVFDQFGRRIDWDGTDRILDATVETGGAATAVTTPGNERWLSVFAQVDEDLQQPEIDGNGFTVFVKRVGVEKLFILMASEQSIGADVKPPLQPDAILMGDFRLIFGQSAIAGGDIDISRRQDYIREEGGLNDLVVGNPRDAIIELLDIVNTGSASASTAGATALNGLNLGFTGPIGITAAFQEVIDELTASASFADEGAGRVGSAGHSSVPPGVALAGGNVSDQLQSLINNIQSFRDDLASTDASSGAVLVGVDAHSSTPTGGIAFAFPDGNLQATLEEIVNDITAAVSLADEGAGRVGSFSHTVGSFSVTTGNLSDQIQQLLVHIDAVNSAATDLDGQTYDGVVTSSSFVAPVFTQGTQTGEQAIDNAFIEASKRVAKAGDSINSHLDPQTNLGTSLGTAALKYSVAHLQDLFVSGVVTHDASSPAVTFKFLREIPGTFTAVPGYQFSLKDLNGEFIGLQLLSGATQADVVTRTASLEAISHTLNDIGSLTRKYRDLQLSRSGFAGTSFESPFVKSTQTAVATDGMEIPGGRFLFSGDFTTPQVIHRLNTSFSLGNTKLDFLLTGNNGSSTALRLQGLGTGSAQALVKSLIPFSGDLVGGDNVGTASNRWDVGGFGTLFLARDIEGQGATAATIPIRIKDTGSLETALAWEFRVQGSSNDLLPLKITGRNTTQGVLITHHLEPASTNSYDQGTSLLRYKNIFASGDAFLGAGIQLDNTGNGVDIDRVATGAAQNLIELTFHFQWLAGSGDVLSLFGDRIVPNVETVLSGAAKLRSDIVGANNPFFELDAGSGSQVILRRDIAVAKENLSTLMAIQGTGDPAGGLSIMEWGAEDLTGAVAPRTKSSHITPFADNTSVLGDLATAKRWLRVDAYTFRAGTLVSSPLIETDDYEFAASGSKVIEIPFSGMSGNISRMYLLDTNDPFQNEYFDGGYARVFGGEEAGPPFSGQGVEWYLPIVLPRGATITGYQLYWGTLGPYSGAGIITTNLRKRAFTSVSTTGAAIAGFSSSSVFIAADGTGSQNVTGQTEVVDGTETYWLEMNPSEIGAVRIFGGIIRATLTKPWQDNYIT